MRTARSLLYRGVSARGGLPNRDPPRQRTHPGQRPPTLDRDCPWIENHPAQRPLPLDRDPPVMWSVVHAGTKTPLPHGQNSWHTLVKTLPCRNFVADGNNANVIILQLQKCHVGWPKERYDLDWLYHLHVHIVKEDKWYAGVDCQGGSIFLRWPQTQKGAPPYPLINLPKKTQI